MGFLSGTVSFTRYQIQEEIPDTLWPDIADRLRRHAFVDIDATAEERSVGWVCFEDMLDTQWEQAPPQKADFVVFCMRLDTRRISPAVFKKHFQLALLQEMQQNAATGREHISRDRKKELREQTAYKILAQTLPVPAIFDVVWNIQTQHVYLASTNTKMRTLFEDQFTLTFDLHLELLSPCHQARQILGPDRMHLIDSMQPGSFV